jgi:hypothetical protein
MCRATSLCATGFVIRRLMSRARVGLDSENLADNISHMDTPDAVRVLTDAMAPVAEPLYRCLEAAADVAEAHLVDFDMADGEYRSGQSHLARAHARRLLKKAQNGGELEPWLVTAPQPNLQLCIAPQLLTLRMLRPDRLQVPKAGPNAARIAYFSNRHTQLFGIEGSKLIGLWGPNDLTGEMQVRVVRSARCISVAGTQSTSTSGSHARPRTSRRWNSSPSTPT